ncbi:unnamed protein product [Rotaria socialis]|uniref:Uncharacterized protein n=1 Tax=Rotaria socialis TaxID=392032 RepID=A0A817ZJ86_9BILA|nr:unnamed protein product [Rotaria socialis]CAF3565029.1 unnamed protein product [Rotaria socialis]CAF4404124.1 unnamed protein product [Rotaria socialis]CAF4685597.1 unnamed protein product [Rotaria socialis]
MMARINLRAAANNDCIITDDGDEDPYNLDLHIVSVFVLLIVSLLGTVFSIITTRIERLRINPIIIETGKFFGSGVVLATGFIHMLPPAMEALTHPCLPDSWNVYSAYAGLFAMLAALVMQFIEFSAHQRYQSRVQPIFNNKNGESKNQENIEMDCSVSRNGTISAQCDNTINHHHHHHHGAAFHDDNQSNKISTYLLEFGIALHSILIGVTLGATSESFVALFIALGFHQFFEAIALGAQIARLDRISLQSIILMVVVFVLTTPVGIAIGIGIHFTAYNPDSVAALLINGILDSVSAGILIYVALVNLITVEMGPGARSFHSLTKRLKLLYFVSLYAGVAAMAVVGRWA